MGYTVTVNAGESRVWLFPYYGTFDAGQTAILTTAEWNALSPTIQALVTVNSSSTPDPTRPWLASTAQNSPSGGGGIGTTTTPSVTRLEDGVIAGQLATVAAFHNADNQALPANSYGLNVGGITQVLNPLGNLNRQRETGFDNIPGTGVATGAQQVALPIPQQTVAAAITTPGQATVTPGAMSGTIRGSAWSIQVGHSLLIGQGTANQESVFVTAVTATTFTAVFTKTHTANWTVNGFVYNQARDASAPDGSPLTGFGGGMTYLLNQNSNGGAGGAESERSAAGELDGASGTGTAIAAEYEHNSGGPIILSTGLASGFNFDRARNLNGKGSQSQTITATTAGATSLTFGSAAATNLVQPGSPVMLYGGAATETVYVSATWVPGSSNVVPLQSPSVVSYANQVTARYDIYGPVGPGLNGFTPFGIGIEEEALFNPVDGLYYIERAATADAMAPQNIVAENPALWNGTTFDRERANQAVQFGAQTATFTSADQLNVNAHALDVIVNLTTLTGGTTPTLVVAINGKTASGLYYPLLTAAFGINGVGTSVFRIGPALTALQPSAAGVGSAANATANAFVPRTFQIVATVNGAPTAISYTVDYNLTR